MGSEYACIEDVLIPSMNGQIEVGAATFIAHMVDIGSEYLNSSYTCIKLSGVPCLSSLVSRELSIRILLLQGEEVFQTTPFAIHTSSKAGNFCSNKLQTSFLFQ